jgi:hypothetical protein
MEGSLTSRSAPGAADGKSSMRERRVDVLRGIALLCIFADHIPDDWLNWVTLRNFGLSDAAELFVMLSGFASMMAFGRTFQREGAGAGLVRIALRCLHLYLFQIGMLLIMLVAVWLWNVHYPLAPAPVGPVIHGGAGGIRRGLTLQSQPSNLNILPLYILLLTVFPAIYAGLRYRPRLTLTLSAGVWLAANLVPGLNLINKLDGTGWFFNPFAWQFIFVLGAMLARVMTLREGNLPRLPWLVALCWLLLAASFVEAFPWQDWGIPNLAPLAMAPLDKTSLAPPRLLHALALVYVVLTWQGLRSLLRVTAVSWIECLGRHSLEVFSLATILALFGQFVFSSYGGGWLTQLLVNVVGLTAMLALARALERGPRKPAAASLPAPALARPRG